MPWWGLAGETDRRRYDPSDDGYNYHDDDYSRKDLIFTFVAIAIAVAALLCFFRLIARRGVREGGSRRRRASLVVSRRES